MFFRWNAFLFILQSALLLRETSILANLNLNLNLSLRIFHQINLHFLRYSGLRRVKDHNVGENNGKHSKNVQNWLLTCRDPNFTITWPHVSSTPYKHGTQITNTGPYVPSIGAHLPDTVLCYNGINVTRRDPPFTMTWTHVWNTFFQAWGLEIQTWDIMFQATDPPSIQICNNWDLS